MLNISVVFNKFISKAICSNMLYVVKDAYLTLTVCPVFKLYTHSIQSSLKLSLPKKIKIHLTVDDICISCDKIIAAGISTQ